MRVCMYEGDVGMISFYVDDLSRCVCVCVRVSECGCSMCARMYACDCMCAHFNAASPTSLLLITLLPSLPLSLRTHKRAHTHTERHMHTHTHTHTHTHAHTRTHTGGRYRCLQNGEVWQIVSENCNKEW